LKDSLFSIFFLRFLSTSRFFFFLRVQFFPLLEEGLISTWYVMASVSQTEEMISRVNSFCSAHFPNMKRFSFDDTVHIISTTCGHSTAAVEDYLISRCMRSSSLRDLASIVKFLAMGPAIDEVKICNQFKRSGTCTFGSRCLYHHVLPPQPSMGRASAQPSQRPPMMQLSSASNNFTAPISSASLRQPPCAPAGPQPSLVEKDASPMTVLKLPPPPCLTFVVPALVDVNGQFIRYLTPDERREC
jgi:hypothetical protein